MLSTFILGTLLIRTLEVPLAFFVFSDRAISYESKSLFLLKCRSVQYATASALCTIYEPGVVHSLHAGSTCTCQSLAKKSSYPYKELCLSEN